jgi:hypothetical protein
MQHTKNFHLTFFTERRLLSFAALVLMVISFSSCFQQYYKTNTVPKIDSAQMDKLQRENKVFIVHTPGEVFLLEKAKINEGVLYGQQEVLNPKYDKYLNPEASVSNRYPRKEKALALSEVHIYTNDSVARSEPVNLSVSQIFRVDVYTKDISATRGSTVISILGISAPVVAVIIVGVASLNSVEHIPLNLSLH